MAMGLLLVDGADGGFKGEGIEAVLKFVDAAFDKIETGHVVKRILFIHVEGFNYKYIDANRTNVFSWCWVWGMLV